MRKKRYFFAVFVFLLVAAIVSAPNSSNYENDYLLTGGGGEINSSNYTNLLVSVLSGNVSSTNYDNEIGVLYDISGPSVVPNTPSPNLSSVGGENWSSSNLNCSAVVSSNESNSLDVTARWYKNGVYNLTLSYNNSYANGTVVSSILDAGNITKYENWSCSMRVNQDSLFSDWGNSSNLTVLNAPPVVSLSNPVDGLLTADRTPLFNWTVTDADGDDVTYEINITPYYGDNPSALDVRHEVGLDDPNYTPSPDLQLLYDDGYHYRWKVRADDGEVNGTWTSEWVFNISTVVGINLISDEVYFGNLGIGESNSTEEGLVPFELENNGTVLINVSVNASSLWTSTGEGEHYQFKADSVSGEEGAFDWASSQTTWFNMPLTAFVVAITELNYDDAIDSAEVDINITVPLSEDFGNRSSTIVFLAEIAE